MKKHFFYLALAVLSTMCTIACSSDDDEDGDSNKVPTVNLSTPPFAQQAVRYELNPELKASASTGDITTAPALKAIELSESGKILLELHNAIVILQEATYSIQDKVYVMKVVDGKAVSTIIQVAPQNNGKEYVVISGLQERDVIIAKGAGFVEEGTVIVKP